MTNKLGSSNPNRIPKPMNEKLKQANLEKDNRKRDRRCKKTSINFKDRRKSDRRKKIDL